MAYIHITDSTLTIPLALLPKALSKLNNYQAPDCRFTTIQQAADEFGIETRVSDRGLHLLAFSGLEARFEAFLKPIRDLLVTGTEAISDQTRDAAFRRYAITADSVEVGKVSPITRTPYTRTLCTRTVALSS